jgi:hypothetical protein
MLAFSAAAKKKEEKSSSAPHDKFACMVDEAKDSV